MSDPKTIPEMLDAAKNGQEFGDILMRMCARVEAELRDDDLQYEVDDET
jgi:hypothetical protein